MKLHSAGEGPEFQRFEAHDEKRLLGYLVRGQAFPGGPWIWEARSSRRYELLGRFEQRRQAGVCLARRAAVMGRK